MINKRKSNIVYVHVPLSIESVVQIDKLVNTQGSKNNSIRKKVEFIFGRDGLAAAQRYLEEHPLVRPTRSSVIARLVAIGLSTLQGDESHDV